MSKKSLAEASRDCQIKEAVLHRLKTQLTGALAEILALGHSTEQKRLREHIAEFITLKGKWSPQPNIAENATFLRTTSYSRPKRRKGIPAQ